MGDDGCCQLHKNNTVLNFLKVSERQDVNTLYIGCYGP